MKRICGVQHFCHILTESLHTRCSRQINFRGGGRAMTYTTSALSSMSPFCGHVEYQSSCFLAKSDMAARRTERISVLQGDNARHTLSEPSNQGFPPKPSGNQPLVPPTATLRIK